MDTQKTTWTDVDIDRNAPMVSTTVDVVKKFDVQNVTFQISHFLFIMLEVLHHLL